MKLNNKKLKIWITSSLLLAKCLEFLKMKYYLKSKKHSSNNYANLNSKFIKFRVRRQNSNHNLNSNSNNNFLINKTLIFKPSQLK